MPFDDSGVYTRLDNTFSNPVAGTPISPTDADTYFDDIDAALNAYYGTSVTSLAVGTGTKTFVTQEEKLFGVGRYVIAVSDADQANFMWGRVTGYTDTSLEVDVLAIGGTGTHADWTIYISGGPGQTGATGATGAPAGVKFNYSTTTSDADPGPGNFRFNNAAIASVSAAYIDNNDADGNSVTSWLDTLDDSTTTHKGYLLVRGVETQTAWAIFSVTGSVVDGTGYRKLTLTYLASGGTFSNGAAFAFNFLRTGDKGASGAGTGDLVSTNNLSDVASASTSRTNLGLGSAAVLANTAVVRYDASQSPSGSEKIQARTNMAAVGVVKKQKFTSSGTYTPSTGMLYCIIECWGAGGGGGGVAGATSQTKVAGGGGGGGYSRLYATAADIGASKTVTIGAAGNGGSAGANNGTAGGDTSVGSLCIAKGGSGGAAGAYSTPGTGGGVAGTGDIASPGKTSSSAFGDLGVSLALGMGSVGAGSEVGGGGPAGASFNQATAGGNASGNGAGGGGASANNSATNAAGGNGTAGLVIITEFCTE